MADLDAIVLLFTADFPPSMSRASVLLDLEFGPTVLSAPAGEREGLHQVAAELETEYRFLGTRDEPGTRLSVELLRQLLGVVLLRVARLPRPPGSGSAEVNEVFRAFRSEVERSFAATRDVQDYAARLGYAPRTVTRACLAATGRTAKQFLDARVTLEAKRLLVHTDLAVAAIGHAVGFRRPRLPPPGWACCKRRARNITGHRAPPWTSARMVAARSSSRTRSAPSSTTSRRSSPASPTSAIGAVHCARKTPADEARIVGCRKEAAGMRV